MMTKNELREKAEEFLSSAWKNSGATRYHDISQLQATTALTMAVLALSAPDD